MPTAVNDGAYAVTEGFTFNLDSPGILANDTYIDKPAEAVFFDGFESADLSATNVDGFAWGRELRTSVCYHDETVDVSVYQSGNPSYALAEDGKDWEGYNGSHCLRFRYTTTASGDPDPSLTEQRFALGTHYPDFWISYWIKVPDNWIHEGENKKFLALWVDNYGEEGSVVFQMWPDGSSGSTLDGQPEGWPSSGGGPTQFLTYPRDQGRWFQIVIRIQAETASEAKDGIIETWSRFEDDDWIKLHAVYDAQTYAAGAATQGISAGYVFGWSNPAYTDETEWLIDNFTIADENIFGDLPG